MTRTLVLVSIVLVTLLLAAGSRSLDVPSAAADPRGEPSGAPTTVSTPTPTASPTTVATATAALNHFLCYEIHRPETRRTVGLADVFGASTATVRRARRFCAPADKNGEDPTAPQDRDHLTGYAIRRTSPRFVERHNRTIVDQFGPLEADLIRPELLLVPTGKALGTTPPSFTAAIDHFECYRVVHARFAQRGVIVSDQFGDLTVDVKRPARFCAAVDKNGEGIRDPAASLMCYRIRTRQRHIVEPISTTNQFGSDTFELRGRRELCVPSQLNEEGSPTPTPTPGGATCCVVSDHCTWRADAAGCVSAGGTAGPAGSVCDSATARCDQPPAMPGNCCELADHCDAGDPVPMYCAMTGGTFVTNAICTPEGECAVD